MTQEEKQLLLIDLSARLPYGVICKRYENGYELVDIDIKRGLVYLLRDEQYVPYSIFSGDEIKPYLRPMSSMTKEEFEEYSNLVEHVSIGNLHANIANPNSFDWLNAHHFDYRGLIPMGLALEAPEGIYRKEVEK